MNIFEILKKEIKNEFNKTVKIDTIFKDVGIDSIDLLNFVIKVEEKFDITFLDSELLNLNSVQDVVTLITKKVNKKK
ncbi:MAG: acyl carrier protein [Candidatus Hepatoplasma vulgare]|nr:MAG: acyl carrier protein [Candidatus Hepatoplasma sp.]